MNDLNLQRHFYFNMSPGGVCVVFLSLFPMIENATHENSSVAAVPSPRRAQKNAWYYSSCTNDGHSDFDWVHDWFCFVGFSHSVRLSVPFETQNQLLILARWAHTLPATWDLHAFRRILSPRLLFVATRCDGSQRPTLGGRRSCGCWWGVVRLVSSTWKLLFPWPSLLLSWWFPVWRQGWWQGWWALGWTVE